METPQQREEAGSLPFEERMFTAGLLSLPTELLQYLCRFLNEEDIISLSNCCVRLADVTNDNRVLARFVTSRVRCLESQDQQVSPAFTPDETKCRAQQQLSMRNHLIANWKNGRGLSYSIEIVHVGIFLGFYKEDFLIWLISQTVQIWDIRSKPTLFMSVQIDAYKEVDVVGNKLTLIKDSPCLVKVIELDFQNQRSFLKCSFSPLTQELPPGHIQDRENPESVEIWDCIFKDNLVLLIVWNRRDRNSSLYIWNITNKEKVFESHRIPQKSPYPTGNVLFRSSYDSMVFIYEEVSYDAHFYQFDVATLKLTDTHIVVPIYRAYDVVFFCNNYLELNDWSEYPKLIISSSGLSDGAVSVKKTFVVDRRTMCLGEIVVVSGKFVVPCLDGIHLVNAITLETECIIPQNTSTITQAYPLSVFGSLFLIVINDHRSLGVWDLERKVEVLNFEPDRLSSLSDIDPFDFESRLLNSLQNFCVKEYNTYQLQSKIVTLCNGLISVTHFW